MVAVAIGYLHVKKSILIFFFMLYSKANSRWTICLKTLLKITKHRRKADPARSKYFLTMTQKQDS